MIKNLSLSILFLANVFTLSCSSIQADKLPSKTQAEIVSETTEIKNDQKSEIQLSSGGKVDFEGVSFNYNPQVFEISAASLIHESPLRDETEKPGGNFPNHVSFTVQIKNKLIEPEATVKIIPIADYRRMYAVSEGYMQDFDERIDNLKKVLKDKQFRDKKPSAKDEIPFMPYYDAGQEFLAKVNHLPSQSGKGIIFLTQYTFETTIINNEGLSYIYQGITNDGKYYILAEFPVRISFLPDSSETDEFEGYKLCGPCTKENIKEYENYILKVTKRLENSPTDKYEPNLKYIEEMMSSIKITR